MLFLLGFAMLTAGVALLIGGDIEFKSGRRLPKPVSRRVGILFVGFFPLILIANGALRLLDPDNAVPAALLNWPIALVCLILGLVWFRRGLEGEVRRVVDVTPLPVKSPPAKKPKPVREAPLPEFDGPAAKQPPATPPSPRGPFDFS
jgi:hypothetical protein